MTLFKGGGLKLLRIISQSFGIHRFHIAYMCFLCVRSFYDSHICTLRNDHKITFRTVSTQHCINEVPDVVSHLTNFILSHILISTVFSDREIDNLFNGLVVYK